LDFDVGKLVIDAAPTATTGGRMANAPSPMRVA